MEIGIPLSFGESAYYINYAYIDYLEKAGYKVRIILPKDTDIYDGLLLPGGIDIDPMYYGEDNNGAVKVNPKYDMSQRKLLHLYRDAGKPVFGICRGFQLIFLELAKDDISYYYQDLDGHRQQNQKLARNIRSHVVFLRGGGEVYTNSMHHQGIRMPHRVRQEKNYVRGWTEDGTVEIIKFGNIFGVQWHPEELQQYDLLHYVFKDEEGGLGE